MVNNKRSDEDLVLAWKKDKEEVFSILKERYWGYGMATISNTVNNKAKVLALGDEKDSLINDAIYYSILRFDKERGTFKQLFSKILGRLVLQRFFAPNRDPLVDSFSLDAALNSEETLYFTDTTILADETSDPKKEYCLKEERDIFINAPYNPKTTPNFCEIIDLKTQGYNFNEIGRIMNMSSRTIRSIYLKAKKHFVNVMEDEKKK